MKKCLLEIVCILMVVGTALLLSEISPLSYEATLLHYLVVVNVFKSLNWTKL